MKISKTLVLSFFLLIFTIYTYSNDLDFSGDLYKIIHKYARSTGSLVANDVEDYIPIGEGDFFIIRNTDNECILSYYNNYQCTDNAILEISFDDSVIKPKIEYLYTLPKNIIVFGIFEDKKLSKIILIRLNTLEFHSFDFKKLIGEDVHIDLIPFGSNFYISALDLTSNGNARSYYEIEIDTLTFTPVAQNFLSGAIPDEADIAYVFPSKTGEYNLIILDIAGEYNAGIYSSDGSFIATNLSFSKGFNPYKDKNNKLVYNISWLQDEGFFYLVQENNKQFSWYYFSVEEEKAFKITKDSKITGINSYENIFTVSENTFISYLYFEKKEKVSLQRIPLFILGKSPKLYTEIDEEYISYIVGTSLYKASVNDLLAFTKKKNFIKYVSDMKKELDKLCKKNSICASLKSQFLNNL